MAQASLQSNPVAMTPGTRRTKHSAVNAVAFKAGNKSGHPLIAVDLSASKYVPKTGTSELGGDSEKIFYPVGSYAQTGGTSSALLYFTCRTQDPTKASSTTPYIRASLTTALAQISTKATDRDLMTVLNSLSGAVAKQLDCASQAALPAGIPAPESALPADVPSDTEG
ncbi:hypothetical protein ACRAWF_43875 [Streptomyces sp. L7]